MEDAPIWDEENAAFRYVDELYEKDEVSGVVGPTFDDMETLYTSGDFDRSLEAENLVRRGLRFSPDDPDLRDLLLDIYYQRTAAAQVRAGELLSNMEAVRLGLTGFLPDGCPLDGPVIDREICILEHALDAHRWALQGGIDDPTALSGGGYFHLLQDNLEVAVPGGDLAGYEIFQTRVPGRDLMPYTYWDPDLEQRLPVGGDPSPLFTGYQDAVLLFGLLRDTGRVASRLALLYAANGEAVAAEAVITETQALLLTQGMILLGIFPDIETDADSDSGVKTSVGAWRQALQSLTTTAQYVRSDKNPLGFDEDFLIFMQKPGGSAFTGLFDSYDLFYAYLDPVGQPLKPLGRAIDALDDAVASYEAYQSTQDNLQTQLGTISDTCKDRLLEIVGVSPDDEDGYEAAKANPLTVAPWGEVAQQLLSIENAGLAIERNRQEIDNLHRKVQIEMERQGAVSDVYITYGEKQARLTEEIGRLQAAQAATNAFSNAFNGLFADSPIKVFGQIFLGVANTACQTSHEVIKSQKEAEKERLAAREKAKIEGLNSDAQIQTWLLEMTVLVIDSQEAALLMAQDVARLKGLTNEVARLETGLEEAKEDLARRYFADPIHRMRAEGDVRRALWEFENAQHWIFFMSRALEYKWNVDFEKDYLERAWTVEEVFRARNAGELVDAYNAMDEFDSNFVYGGHSFDILSLRWDILGYLDGHSYEDPLNPGTFVDAITAFRNYLKSQSKDNGNLILQFSTAREIPGTNLFLGPTFDEYGNVVTRGRYVDKISKLLVAVVGEGASSETQLAGILTYGGTSHIRRQHVGQFDPERPDRLMDELTTYSTRFWTEDVAAQKFVSEEAQTVSLDVQVNPDLDLSCYSYTVGENEALCERSVATSNWRLLIMNPDIGGFPALDLDAVDDIEIHICHNWRDRSNY